MNGLDLFSGYGGAQDTFRGLVRPIAYCEIEQGARRILLRRMRKGQIAAAPIWDDVRTLRRRNIAAQIDFITGGFPCQDVSSAGTKQGLAGKRSGLFFQIIRLAREFKPTFVYLENVPGLLVRGMDRVCSELAAAGYDHRWGVLSAHDVGAPHLRERVWILAANSNKIGQWRLQQECISERRDSVRPYWNGSTWTTAYTDSVRQSSAQKVWKRFSGASGSCAELRGGEVPKPALCRGDDGLANWSDRIGALGNGWVPESGREAFIRLMGLEGA